MVNVSFSENIEVMTSKQVPPFVYSLVREPDNYGIFIQCSLANKVCYIWTLGEEHRLKKNGIKCIFWYWCFAGLESRKFLDLLHRILKLIAST